MPWLRRCLAQWEGLPDRRKTTYILSAILTVAALLYLPIFRVPLLSDDWHLAWIAKESSQPWWRYFLTNYAGGLGGYAYRPIQIIYYLAAYRLGGLDATAYHLIGLLFHLANVALVFALARKLKIGGLAFPALAAILFAVFPNHPEAVAWPSAIGDLTATCFYLSAVILWIAARERGKAGWYAAACLAGALALASKDMAISLPVVIALWEILDWRRDRLVRRIGASLLRLLPFAAVTVLYLLVRMNATGYLLGYYGAPKVAIDAMVAIRAYLAIPVSHFLSMTARTEVMDWLYRVVDTRLEAALIATAIAAGLIVLGASKKYWWLVLSFSAAIAPVMQLGLNHIPWRLSEEGERYAYLPSAFFAIALAWAVVAFARKARANRIIAAIAVLAMLSSMTFQLEIKLGDWVRAGRVSEDVFYGWSEINRSEPGASIYTVGLPDNYRGVPLWRNGLAEALSMRFGQSPENTVTAVRTVLDPGSAFTVSETGDGYVYSSDDGRPDIAAPLSVSEKGYEAELGKRSFSIYALSHRDFSDSVSVRLDASSSPGAVVYFFSGEDWIARRPSVRE